MLRTMKRLIALSLGMALPVEAHLLFLCGVYAVYGERDDINMNATR